MGSVFTKNCIEACFSVFIGVLLPLGTLITSTLASTTSFSPDCHIRADVLVILQNVILFLTCSMYTYLEMPWPYSSTHHSIMKEMIICGFKMVGSISVPIFTVLLVIVADTQGICYQQSTNYSLVWYSIMSIGTTAATVVISFIFLCKFLSRRKRIYWQRHEENMKIYLKAKSMLTALMNLKGTREGWKLLHDQFSPVY